MKIVSDEVIGKIMDYLREDIERNDDEVLDFWYKTAGAYQICDDDWQHDTALTVYSKYEEHHGWIKRLIAEYTDLDFQDEELKTGIWHLCDERYTYDSNTLELLREMLSRGANPNIRDTYGVSPLQKIARVGNEEYMKLLLEYGGDLYYHKGEAYSAFELLETNSEESAKQIQEFAQSLDIEIRPVPLTKKEIKKSKFQELWEKYVPEKDEADTVQGEVLRSFGNLADECERNGNINWDERHKGYAKYLKGVFLSDELAGKFSISDEQLAKDLKELGQKTIRNSTRYDANDRIESVILEWCEMNGY